MFLRKNQKVVDGVLYEYWKLCDFKVTENNRF